MAIAFDSYSTNSTTTWGSGVSSVTWSHTCSGSDRILIVGVFNADGVIPTGITYGGEALTHINTANVASFRNSLWYLIAPNTGANNVVVTWAASNGLFNCGAMSYTGVAQSGQPDSSNTAATASGSSITVSTTVVENNSWLVGLTAGLEAGTFSVTGDCSERSGTLPGNLAYVDSNGSVDSGSRSSTMTITGSNSSKGYCIASIAPSVPSSNNTLSFGGGM